MIGMPRIRNPCTVTWLVSICMPYATPPNGSGRPFQSAESGIVWIRVGILLWCQSGSSGSTAARMVNRSVLLYGRLGLNTAVSPTA